MSMNTYTPFPAGEMPSNVELWEDGPPFGRLHLDVDHYPTDDGEIVLDRTSGERFEIRTGIACDLGCRCAAEARWVRAATGPPACTCCGAEAERLSATSAT